MIESDKKRGKLDSYCAFCILIYGRYFSVNRQFRQKNGNIVFIDVRSAKNKRCYLKYLIFKRDNTIMTKISNQERN